MATLSTTRVKIAGLAACVPRRIEENIDLPIFASREEAEKTIASTGIERRRVCNDGVTASDLAEKAVVRLLADLGWSAESVDCLFFVSMTRDYLAPQTACILQGRLGLREDCFVMDLPLGCSGWVYGMSVATSMMQTGQVRKLVLRISAHTVKMTTMARYSRIREKTLCCRRGLIFFSKKDPCFMRVPPFLHFRLPPPWPGSARFPPWLRPWAGSR